MNNSLFYPINIKTPFYVGVNHFKQGIEKITTGDNNGVFDCILGVSECVPLANYVLASYERSYQLATPEMKMNERFKILQRERMTHSVKLQQVYFETHNSQLPGKVINSSPIYQTLDYSYPDRELISIIEDLNEFYNNLNGQENECQILQKSMTLFQKMQPLAVAITCLIVEQSELERSILRKKIIEMIISQLQDLKKGEEVLIPFGHIRGDVHDLKKVENVGHMTLLEIKRVTEDTCSGRIFNSGEGSDAHAKEGERIHPIEFPTLPFNEISKEAFWVDMLETVIGQEGNLKEGYHKFNQLNAQQNLTEQQIKNSKAYRPQEINHCAKKSLQIWLHDQLKNDPILYQKFRIFALQKKLREMENILSSHPETQLAVNHSVALWGSSDRVPQLIDNIFYKIKGFLFGPYVKCAIPRVDVVAMKEYGDKVLKWREVRLMVLQGRISEAISLVQQNPLSQRKKIKKKLIEFCKRKNLDGKWIQREKFLTRVEVEELTSETYIQKEIQGCYYKSINPAIDRLFALEKIVNLLIYFNELDKAISLIESMKNSNVKDKMFLKWFTSFLENNPSESEIIKFREKSEQLASFNPDIDSRFLFLTQLAKILFPYGKSHYQTLLDQMSQLKTTHTALLVPVTDFFFVDIEISLFFAKKIQQPEDLIMFFDQIRINKEKIKIKPAEVKQIKNLILSLIQKQPAEKQLILFIQYLKPLSYDDLTQVQLIVPSILVMLNSMADESKKESLKSELVKIIFSYNREEAYRVNQELQKPLELV